MSKKSVILMAEDLPSTKSLVDSISRLRKDYSLLQRLKGSKDIEDPDSFKRVIGFLEMLLKREKRNLPKTETDPNFMEVMIEIVALHISEMDPWEAKCVIKETGLLEVFKKAKDDLEDESE